MNRGPVSLANLVQAIYRELSWLYQGVTRETKKKATDQLAQLSIVTDPPGMIVELVSEILSALGAAHGSSSSPAARS